MNFSRLALTTACLTIALPTIALTQSTTNNSDRLGDYYSNEAPLKGATQRALMAGSLWKVVASQLNCRRSAGNEQAIVRRFKQGDVLEAEVYRGGSDEVLRNATDRSGKPWMPIRGTASASTCYVRANKRYIQPLASHAGH
ncbi:MAG: hypothetical protein ACAF41_22300 [Leptolyngbya sp. BL-A-14]